MNFSSRISQPSGNGHQNGTGHLNGKGHFHGNGHANGNGNFDAEKTAVPGVSAVDANAADAKQTESETRREASGRFTKGNKGGPGNPYNRRVAMLKRWLLEVVGEKEIKAMGKKLLEMALEGDVAAARVLFQYVMPKHVDPDMVDFAEWEGYKKKAPMFAELPGIVSKPAADLPLDIMRAAQPSVTDDLRNMTANLMRTPQSKMEDVLGMLRDDPRTAREYLDMGPDLFFGKKPAAKDERTKKAKRRKR